MPRASTTTAKATSSTALTSKPRGRAAKSAAGSTGKKQSVDKNAPKKSVREKTATRSFRTNATTKTTVATTKPAKLASVIEEQEIDQVTEHNFDITDTIDGMSAQSGSTTARRRKAPTAFAQHAEEKRTSRNQMIVFGVLVALGIAASAAVGFSDPSAGQIDVTKTIEERNARMANMVDVDGPTIVAPRPSTQPDGGFIASPVQNQRLPVATSPIEQSTSTATSTNDGTASSTNNGTGEQIATSTDEVTGGQVVDDTTTASSSVQASSDSEEAV